MTLVDEFVEIRDRLLPAYIDYCHNVSPRTMAISLETATFAFWACQTRGVERPADLGSGFTSYMLRVYAADTDAEVTSVDDSPEWLERTGEFLTRHNLPDDGLVLWPEFEAGDSTHDLIVHDFSKGEQRETAMKVAVDRLEPGGIVIFDDAQHQGHLTAMYDVCRDMELLDIREPTLDAVGRFALAAIK